MWLILVLDAQEMFLPSPGFGNFGSGAERGSTEHRTLGGLLSIHDFVCSLFQTLDDKPLRSKGLAEAVDLLTHACPQLEV